MIAGTIKMSEAIQRMRDLTELNIPFSFSFITYSEKSNKSEFKTIKKALLRKGYRQDQSKKANVLIAYLDYDNTTILERQFYLPLLMTFNNQTIKP